MISRQALVHILKTSALLCVLGLATSSRAEERLEARISQIGEAVHVEVIGIQEWAYNLVEQEKDGKKVVELEVPNLDEKSIQMIKAWKGPLIEKIELVQVSSSNQVKLIFVGRHSKIETFDYLTDQPSRLIVDIFPSATDKQAESKPVKTQKKSEPVDQGVTRNISILRETGERMPASDLLVPSNEGLLLMDLEDPAEKIKGGIFDGADPEYTRFSMANHEINEDAIIKSRENVYLPFPMLELPNHNLDRIRKNQPIYEIKEKPGEENRFARLLETLFENKRNAVFLKTVAWFREKYPESIYNELIDFMTADVHYRLWEETKSAEEYNRAMTAYRQAIGKYPQSALYERANMLMGFSALEQGDPLGAIRVFQMHLAKNPQSENRDIASLAMAEAFIKLRKFRDAEEIYSRLEKEGSSLASKIESAYLKGNVYIKENKYNEAIDAYQKALTQYPDDWGKYPNAFYNSAEALFWMGRYKESLDKYRDYIRRFPSDGHAGYAMTRLGELLEILGADPKRVLGAYLEAHFRYGINSGAGIARMRFLSERMKNMKKKEVLDAVGEINAIVKDSELPRIQEFSRIMTADGFWRRKEYDQAVEILAKHYKSNPLGTNTDVLAPRIVRYINDDLSSKITNGKHYEALKIHQKHFNDWLKQSNRIDTPYYLASAFEQSGVPAEAERVYKDTLNKLQAIQGTKLEKERGIFETLPTLGALNLRLAAVALEQGKDKEAFRYLKAIEKPEDLPIESQLERVDIASRILEEQGDLKTALLYVKELIDTWRAKPALAGPAYLRYAELAYQNKEYESAEKMLSIMLNLQTDTEKLKEDTHAKGLELMAGVKLELGDRAGAKTHLTQLLDLYEAKRPLSSARYRLGNIQFEDGLLQGARDTWEKLDPKKDGIWSQLAQERLASQEWSEEYQKYIQRIPAMAGRE